MKNLIITVFIFVILNGCTGKPEKTTDVTPPLIYLIGNTCDTICTGIEYMDPGAEPLGEFDKEGKVLEIPVNVTGTVNTNVPGTYLLHYNTADAAGNKAATVTRTVQVVNNSADFLAGVYNVACSCTASVKGSNTPTVITDSYMASVKHNKRNRHFEIGLLRIGPEYIIPSTVLGGDNIDIYHVTPDYQEISAFGKVSREKNAFTIETVYFRYYPAVTYACKNVYTKP